MTTNADFKRRVRERMRRTGESYTTARARLLERTTLHVTNGDSTVSGIEQTGLPGRILPWRDVLHEGPVPDGPDGERRGVRAQFLADDEHPAAEIEAWLTERDHTLATHAGDFLLWFEADLYDQLQLAEVLHRLRAVAPARITLVSVGEHVGVARFGGLGELDGGQLAALPRTPLTAAALALGARAWAALTSPDPTRIAGMTRQRSGELRFLAEGFTRLAREYPSTRDGLSLTERRLLASAPGTRAELFLEAGRKEERPFLGDTWAFRILDRLTAAGLLARDADVLVRTPAGDEVLAGRADHVARHGVDRWIGGVHLRGRAVPWRWDDATETLVETRA